ncbi:MAG: hypothetical protein ACLQME_21200 [Alphaproteobacteria bacterium]
MTLVHHFPEVDNVALSADPQPGKPNAQQADVYTRLDVGADRASQIEIELRKGRDLTRVIWHRV